MDKVILTFDIIEVKKNYLHKKALVSNNISFGEKKL